MICKNEFEVLCAFAEHPGFAQRELTSIPETNPDIAGKAYEALSKAKLVEGGQITAKGMRELQPFKVDNAVIMAAGRSSRFAPISDKIPKGLLRVRGEILIERQIEQLIDAGIDDIFVVVGYKKELFFYLEQKYGVKIVVNDEFASRNNHSTLMRVREQLGNTYICSSDNYFEENPFSQYVWKTYYSCEYANGPTKEWCLQFDEDGRIRDVRIGGKNSWYMIGPAYFDKEFSKRFREILEDEYDDPGTANKLWEDLYIEHIDELDMEVRKYEPNVIHEFDSLDELVDFDPLFRENLVI